MTWRAISDVTGFLTTMFLTAQQFITILEANMLEFDAAFDVAFVLTAVLIFCAFFLATNVAIEEVFTWNCLFLTSTAALNFGGLSARWTRLVVTSRHALMWTR